MNSTFFRLPPSIYVNHMERDRHIPENMLLSDYHKLLTTDGNDIVSVYDFWAADRTSIWGFTQTSEYDIVFVDQYNNCLRLYNRLQDTVEKLVGSCDNRYPGFRDGTDVLFYSPVAVMQDNQAPCLLYVIDSRNGALRMVTKTRIPHVTTLIKNDHKEYTGLTQEPEGRYLYITYFEGLERYDLVTNTSLDIVSVKTMYTNDALMYDNAIEHLFDIILLRNWIIIADQTRHVLFVVDLTNNTTSTICTGIAGHRSGNASDCRLAYPGTLLELNGNIYIGEHGHISMMRGTTYCYHSEHHPSIGLRGWLKKLKKNRGNFPNSLQRGHFDRHTK